MIANEMPRGAAVEVAPPQTRFRQSEWRFGALLVVLVLLMSIGLSAFAYLSAPPDRVFTGVIYNIPDHNQYFAWMRDLAHENLAPNRLTAEPNDPALFHLLWWSAARVGALFDLSPAAIFESLRILAILTLFPVVYAFIHIAVANALQRKLAMLLFTFGGGMGIIWVVVKYLFGLPDAPFPFDIYTSEPNSFFIALAFPHFGFALALVIAVIGLTLYAQQRQQLRYAVAAGVVGALVGLQHAYDLLTIYSVLGIWGLLIWWRDQRFPLFLGKAALIIAAFTIPPAAYLAYLVLTDATWGGKLAQFDNAGAWTPNLLHLPILMGVPLLLALIGFRPRMLRSRNDAELLVAVWFLAHFVLAYLPVKFQIHLLLGWQVPIAILGALALTTIIVPWLRQRMPRWSQVAFLGILGLCVITNVYILSWRFVDLGRYAAPFYLSQHEVAALAWLGTNTTRADVVLGTLEINQHVPVWSDARAFLAHWAGTLDYFVKQDLVTQVLDPATADAERRAIFAQFQVTYVIVRDADSPPGALQAAAPTLQPVFTQGDVRIYAVTR
jgi:xanthosine utilization system XapX-like protein